ncbi:hypothetical protein D3C87_1687870 [compost metagenome]
MRQRHHLPFPRLQLGDVALSLVDEAASQEDRDNHHRDGDGDRQLDEDAVFGKLLPSADGHGRQLPHAAC